VFAIRASSREATHFAVTLLYPAHVYVTYLVALISPRPGS
jgi:hypothetical protein